MTLNEKQPKTYIAEEAADFLHIHKNTVQKRACSGEIKGYKPGRRWVFLEADLIEYLKSTQPVSSRSYNLRLTAPKTRPVPEDESPLAKLIAEERLRLCSEKKRSY